MQELGLEASLQQAALALQPGQQLSLTSLVVSLAGTGGAGGSGGKQQLLQLESLQVHHTHSAGPGLGWLLERDWRLERLSCSVGALTLEAGPEAEAALLGLLQRRRQQRRARSAQPKPPAGSGKGGVPSLRLLPQEVGAMHCITCATLSPDCLKKNSLLREADGLGCVGWP